MLLQRLSAVGGSMADEGDRVLELALPAAASSAGDARRALAGYCRAHVVPPDLTEPGLLALTELVTNAVLHAKTPTMVWAEFDEDQLTLAVLDGGATLPRLLALDNGERLGGRGIAVIAELGASWGLVRT